MSRHSASVTLCFVQVSQATGWKKATAAASGEVRRRPAERAAAQPRPSAAACPRSRPLKPGSVKRPLLPGPHRELGPWGLRPRARVSLQRAPSGCCAALGKGGVGNSKSRGKIAPPNIHTVRDMQVPVPSHMTSQQLGRGGAQISAEAEGSLSEGLARPGGRRERRASWVRSGLQGRAAPAFPRTPGPVEVGECREPTNIFSKIDIYES